MAAKCAANSNGSNMHFIFDVQPTPEESTLMARYVKYA